MCQYFYPETLSSAVLPYELATEFFEAGYSVDALVGYPNEYLKTDYNVPEHQNVHGINVTRLKYSSANRHSKLGRIANIVSLSAAVLLKPSFIKKSDYIICFTNPPLLPYVAALYAKIFHKKLIVVIYDLYPDAPIKLGYLKSNSKIATAFTKMYNTVFNNSYKIVVLSSEMKKYLIKNKKIDEAKIKIIPNWYKDCHREIQYKSNFPLTILYGGNMGEAQEMDTLLTAAKILKNDSRFRFMFVGQGSQKNKVDNFIKKNGLDNCCSEDFMTKEMYDELIENVSITVLSLKQEVCGLGSPSKFYGYLAAKKPVIAIVPDETDVVRDINGYRCGCYVPLGNAGVLVGFLKKCAEKPELLHEMSENSYKLFMDKYTLKHSFEKYKNVIEE